MSAIEEGSQAEELSRHSRIRDLKNEGTIYDGDYADFINYL